VLGGVLLGAAPAPAAPAAPADDPAPPGFVLPEQVDLRNFTDADKVFLDKVKQAGLWEMPAGDQASRKGLGPRVREVGGLIASDHKVLDDDVERVAARFGYRLPTEPNVDQREWLKELNAKTGRDYDATFAQRLRYAHGVVYGAIANVRANSRNALMRLFAKQCEIFVHRHMSLLESTGEVDFDGLPPVNVPKGNLRAADMKNHPLTMIALFALTGAIGVVGVTRALRGTA
jgi:predicted outer membrane protein